MTTFDDVRKTIEATIGNLTPSRAQELAKGMMEPNAAKEQIAKTAADLIEWSQRYRDRVGDLIRHEISNQMRQMGAATQGELDALKKRVRDLERAAGMTASGRKTSAAAAKKTTSSPAKAKAKATKSKATKTTVKRSAAKAKPAGAP